MVSGWLGRPMLALCSRCGGKKVIPRYSLTGDDLRDLRDVFGDDEAVCGLYDLTLKELVLRTEGESPPRSNPERHVPLFVAHTVLAIVRKRASKRGVDISRLTPRNITELAQRHLRSDVSAAFAIAVSQGKKLGYLTEASTMAKMTPTGAGKQSAHSRHVDDTADYEALLALVRKH